MRITKEISLLHLFGLMLLVFKVCEAVKIKSISVPSIYVLDDDAPNPEPLILDCIYDADEKESGFVLKWYLNNIQIYQWIPSRSAFALATFKGRVDLNYTVSDERLQKHRALYINKPSASDSGEYACNVQTFESNDKKVAKMQVIIPEESFVLDYSFENEETVKVSCTATNMLPEPTLTLLYDNEELKEELMPLSKNSDEDKLYDVSLSAVLKKQDLKDDTKIKCLLKVPGTSYLKQKDVTYNDPMKTTTKKSLIGELSRIADSKMSAVENAAFRMQSSTTIILTAAMVYLASLF